MLRAPVRHVQVFSIGAVVMRGCGGGHPAELGRLADHFDGSGREATTGGAPRDECIAGLTPRKDRGWVDEAHTSQLLPPG
jgi:hypothetical protein